MYFLSYFLCEGTEKVAERQKKRRFFLFFLTKKEICFPRDLFHHSEYS